MSTTRESLLLSSIKAHLRISREADSDEITVYYQPETGTDNSYCFRGLELEKLLIKVILAQEMEKELK